MIAIKNARSKPKPYNVFYLDHTFFKKYDTIQYFKSISPGKKAGDPCVTGSLQYKGNTNEILFNLRFLDDWSCLPIRMSSSAQPSELHDTPRLYNKRVPIKKSKYDDFQSLKSTLPIDYHSFYDNLPYKFCSLKYKSIMLCIHYFILIKCNNS